MTPHDFCNWFQGVLDMAVDEEGAASFTKLQTAKINTRLKEALEPKKGMRPPPHMTQGDGLTRC